jgi:hypothetical protein
MRITKVELVGGGFKGLNVTYLKEENKNGMTKIKEVIEKPRYPIHLGLEVPFKDLRYYLLNICDILGEDLGKMEKDSLMNDCEVTSVIISNEHFVIKGTKSVFGDKAFSLTSPKVEEGDGYFHYDTVKSVIEKIVEETKAYMAGDVVIDSTEVVTRWIGAGKSKGFDIESFNALSPEDRDKFCTEVLEKDFGKVVIGAADYSVNEEEEEEETEEDQDNGFILEPNAEVVILPAKK